MIRSLSDLVIIRPLEDVSATSPQIGGDHLGETDVEQPFGISVCSDSVRTPISPGISNGQPVFTPLSSRTPPAMTPMMSNTLDDALDQIVGQRSAAHVSMPHLLKSGQVSRTEFPLKIPEKILHPPGKEDTSKTWSAVVFSIYVSIACLWPLSATLCKQTSPENSQPFMASSVFLFAGVGVFLFSSVCNGVEWKEVLFGLSWKSQFLILAGRLANLLLNIASLFAMKWLGGALTLVLRASEIHLAAVVHYFMFQKQKSSIQFLILFILGLVLLDFKNDALFPKSALFYSNTQGYNSSDNQDQSMLFYGLLAIAARQICSVIFMIVMEKGVKDITKGVESRVQAQVFSVFDIAAALLVMPFELFMWKSQGYAMKGLIFANLMQNNDSVQVPFPFPLGISFAEGAAQLFTPTAVSVLSSEIIGTGRSCTIFFVYVLDCVLWGSATEDFQRFTAHRLFCVTAITALIILYQFQEFFEDLNMKLERKVQFLGALRSCATPGFAARFDRLIEESSKCSLDQEAFKKNLVVTARKRRSNLMKRHETEPNSNASTPKSLNLLTLNQFTTSNEDSWNALTPTMTDFHRNMGNMTKVGTSSKKRWDLTMERLEELLCRERLESMVAEAVTKTLKESKEMSKSEGTVI